MLNKYKFITIMEGEFCKIIIYKICVSNQSFISLEQTKNQQSFGVILKHLQSTNGIQFQQRAFATLKGCESMQQMSSHNIESISKVNIYK